MDPELKKLICVRKGHRSYITKLHSELLETDKPIEDTRRIDIHETLISKKQVLADLDTNILQYLKDDDEIEKEILGLNEFQEKFTECLRLSSVVKSSNIKEESSSNKVNVKLPKIEIAKFDGSFNLFQGFWDQFTSCIDSNSDISSIDKFNYLKSFLSGDALQLICGLTISNNNYEKAKLLLKERFGNDQILISNHMDRFVKLSKLHDMDVIPLRKMFDLISTTMDNLVSLGVTCDNYGALLVNLIYEKLPSELQIIISRHFAKTKWELAELMVVFKTELMAQERRQSVVGSESNEFDSYNDSYNYSGTFVNQSSWDNNNCPFCNGNHNPEKCLQFKTNNERYDALQKQRKCFRCFRNNHIARYCRNSYNFCNCGKKHNIILCPAQYNATHVSTFSVNIVLQSARVEVMKCDNVNIFSAFLLLDSCSQRSYITDDMRNKLKLTTLRKEYVVINTFASNQNSATYLDVVGFYVKGINFQSVFIEALVVPFICANLQMPDYEFVQSKFDYLQGLTLANYYTDSKSVDILVGLDYYYSIISGRTIKSHAKYPVAIDSIFGWIICGPINRQYFPKKSHINRPICSVITTNLIMNNDEYDLRKDLEKFWITESSELLDVNVYEEFMKTVHFSNGRYVARLPFKPFHDELPNNFDLSLARLNSLMKKLNKDASLMSEYVRIINEYEQLGIVQKVVNVDLSSEVSHYIPHRAVIRDDKETTKVRIVFDGSSKCAGYPSINDCLYSGPCLLTSIFDILVRFRYYRIGIIADIEKAFLNIGIVEEHRNFLRFLWKSENNNLIHYRFCRLVFGLTCSPFILNGTLVTHLSSYKLKDSQLSERLASDLYVDDLTSGVDSVTQGLDLYYFAIDCFRAGNFNLRKWATSSKDLALAINLDNQNSKSEENMWKNVLGLKWNVDNDKFCFDFDNVLGIKNHDVLTKRTILKFGARFYDPLGLISPITIQIKIIFQLLCVDKLTWDEVVPNNILVLVTEFLNKLEKMDGINVPRRIIDDYETFLPDVELHGFSDASKTSYAAVIYVRVCIDGIYKTSILCSKTKVAPLSVKKIPRLELLGCLLLSELLCNVQSSLKNVCMVKNYFCWTDSEICLYWIKGNNKEWKPWVEHRVNKIRSFTKFENWYWVCTGDNPADIPTREVNVNKFVTNSVWWIGPSFLLQDISKWYFKEITMDDKFDETVEELKKVILTKIVTNHPSSTIEKIMDISRFSCLLKLLKTTAYVYRFIYNLKSKCITKIAPKVSFIDSIEIKNCRILWILTEQNQIRSSSKFQQLYKSLKLFEDECGLLRLAGRLGMLNIDYNSKYPILLSSDSHFTKLIVLEAHKIVKHGGVESTLNQIRTDYWIIKGRQVVRKLLKKCVTCKWIQGKHATGPVSPDLPEHRLNVTFPFATTGLDFAGPIEVYDIYSKKKILYKSYILLFTCAYSRNVHLELTPGMDIGCVIRAIKRFISRRGIINLFISDNFSTFKSQQLCNFLNKFEIRWEFILPKSPWWGGFYEHLVGVVKSSLKKSVGNSKLNFEEMMTIVCEVELVVNSRPLVYVNDENYEILTPSHLLHGRRLLSKYETGNYCGTDDKNDAIGNFNNVNNILKHFSKRFSKEYMSRLREHHIYTNSKTETFVEKGDMVLVDDFDKKPRHLWKKAVVDELIVGRDGKCRGAILKIFSNTNGISLIRRPLKLLIPFKVKNSVFPQNLGGECGK